MKPSPWMFPCAAVLLGGTWIALQRNSAAELRREITVIQERIRQSRLWGQFAHRDKSKWG